LHFNSIDWRNIAPDHSHADFAKEANPIICPIQRRFLQPQRIEDRNLIAMVDRIAVQSRLMKRLRRQLFNGLAAASLLLLLALTLLEVRSFDVVDSVTFKNSHMGVIIYPWRGRACLRSWIQSGYQGRPMPFYRPIPLQEFSPYLAEWMTKTPARREKSTLWYFDIAPLGSFEHVLVFPIWFLIAIALILPVQWLRLARRRSVAFWSGRCMNCGYDLRATPDRCPECGAIPARQKPVPT
jgi:hypothetical protein